MKRSLLIFSASSLAGLRRVALLERRLRIEVVTRRLDEGSDGLVLRRGGDLRKDVAVLVELPLEGRRDVDERLRRHLLRSTTYGAYREIQSVPYAMKRRYACTPMQVFRCTQ